MLKQNLLPLGKKGIRFSILIAVPLLWLFTTGCDETFQPWQENDQYHFSIYGFLDASADTQWVRLMPVREDFFLDPDRLLEATVTLEHIESGESVVMKDSLFAYANNVYAYNFWTTMDLKPKQSYRLTARHTDAPANRYTSVEVILPADFATPLVHVGAGADGNKDLIFVEGVERLADVQTVYHGRDPTTDEIRIIGLPHRQDTSRTIYNDFQIVIDSREDRQALIAFPTIFKRQIFVAAAGPGFTDFDSIGEKIIALPEGPSNITNGVGYLAGILSKTVPYNSCFGEDNVTRVPCPLEPSPW